MPTCEHGHDHNIFIVEGDIHDCKTCGACAHLREQEKAKPSNDDLLDRLINAVLERTYVDGLPYVNQEGDLPDVQPYVPDRQKQQLREEMSDIMRNWVHEVFPRNRGDDPKEE